MNKEQGAAINNLMHWVAQWRKDNVGKATPQVVVAAEHLIHTFGGPKPPWREDN